MSSLRGARWQDIPRLAALECDLFVDHAWSEATWWSELAGRPRREYVVDAEAPGPRGGAEALLGYAGLDVSGEVADVMTIAVAPAAQGHGVGLRLLDELIARARARGAEWLMLEVRADNAAARSMYEKRGFSVLQVRPRYYQPGDVDGIVMRLALVVGADA